MDTALALADWDGFPARRAEARARGKLRGIGIANYVEITSGAPRERTEITVLPEGRVELVMGTMSSGQGHETSFAQLVTEWLGVPFESIGTSPTTLPGLVAGGGSHSGRSMKLATTIIGKATDDIIDKGRKIAGFLLETGEIDIEFDQRADTGSPAPIAKSASSRSPRPPSRARICRRICKGRSPASPTRRSPSPASLTARRSARSRSIPKPARLKSSAILQLTMSGAPSIR